MIGGGIMNREAIETDIRRLVETSIDGVDLSNALFSPPDGLFCKLGPTFDDRQAIIGSDLYNLAQARVHDLMEIEADCLAKARVEIARQVQALPVRGLQNAETSH